MSDRPAPSLRASGGASIRPLGDGDQDLLRELHRHRDNAVIAGSLETEDPEFLSAIRAAPWSTPMVLSEDGEPVAAAMIVAADTQHGHGRLVLLARDPRRAQAPLSLYLRHVFWSHPLHRSYTLMPTSLSQGIAYSDLFRASGFVAEGRLAGHFRVGMRLLDLDVFGLLRGEFDAWCRAHQPGLLLE